MFALTWLCQDKASFIPAISLFYSIYWLNAMKQGTVSVGEAKFCLVPVDLSFLPLPKKG